ncbi:hypothetical protein [Variovorax sp. JS1663]|uniref:hypothetical protein n=1 Tax=Variovorax sp. JS1663 TaxID=1851577 RepID=UPI000B349CE7|nr:hypothetical protein [Variovorax sp. JS1663]OUL98758.1 hypothetical protein A8M77_29895 [Variovorax sp. JS1663]
MTPERLRQLADAWGADPRRWPEAERAAALRLLAHDTAARAQLARAVELDQLLDLHAVAAPDTALARRAQDAMRAPPRTPVRWWWPGLGAAGLGLAGAAAGALAMSIALAAVVPATRPAIAASGWSTSIFDTGTAADWSEE